MDDDSPCVGHKALSALQPHRQPRRLGPLWRRVALHLGRVEDVAGLNKRLT